MAAEAEGRERVLLELTQAVQALVQEGAEVDENRGQGAVVTEAEHPGVQALCLTVEQACLHGIKTQVMHAYDAPACRACVSLHMPPPQ